MDINQLNALEDVVLSFVNEEPHWQREDSPIQLRYSDRRYFVIDEVDAGRLETIRKILPLLIDERRKLTL